MTDKASVRACTLKTAYRSKYPISNEEYNSQTGGYTRRVLARTRVYTMGWKEAFDECRRTSELVRECCYTENNIAIKQDIRG